MKLEGRTESRVMLASEISPTPEIRGEPLQVRQEEAQVSETNGLQDPDRDEEGADEDSRLEATRQGAKMYNILRKVEAETSSLAQQGKRMTQAERQQYFARTRALWLSFVSALLSCYAAVVHEHRLVSSA
mmetsp:Transcript_28294/g.72174  ORF Transcript_28294/g.72174 Transcript_28294/m.72174 type:complete len:130 (-) Transcript_28294:707-1096(-)